MLEHAQGEVEPLAVLVTPSDKQVNAQLFHVLAMLVKEVAMKKARNAPVGLGIEIWRLLCEEYEPRKRRKFLGMLSAILWVQLREPQGESLDNFQRQERAHDDQSGKTILDEKTCSHRHRRNLPLHSVTASCTE